MMRGICFIGLAVGLMVGLGQAGAGAAPELAREAPFLPQIFRVLGTLAALLGALLVGLYAWKRFGAARAPEGGPLIKVLATQPLSPKKALILVAVGEEKFLLATAGEQLTFLTPVRREAGRGPQEREPAAL